jgi:hypothetical protein
MAISKVEIILGVASLIITLILGLPNSINDYNNLLHPQNLTPTPISTPASTPNPESTPIKTSTPASTETSTSTAIPTLTYIGSFGFDKARIMGTSRIHKVLLSILQAMFMLLILSMIVFRSLTTKGII